MNSSPLALVAARLWSQRNAKLRIALLSSALLCLLIPFARSQTRSGGAPNQAQPSSLHQWGAVTLFHGLPSDRVRAIAQDGDGAMWFGTDAGLAKYDGRRTQTITDAELPEGRVTALKIDASGVLWVGTEGGAVRLTDNRLHLVKETEGKAVNAILALEDGRTLLASDEGLIFDCRTPADGSLVVNTIPDAPLRSADVERPGPLRITSLARADGRIYAGTRSRGLLMLEEKGLKEVQSRPRPFFIEALVSDGGGSLWLGTKTKGEEGGLYLAKDAARPSLIDGSTGAVTALSDDGRGGIWAGTDGRGVFRYKDGERVLRFTFDGTAGGLRSDHIYSIFVDREDVVWFGTDRGVCRYDPYALRVEKISDNPESNFVRDLWRMRDGRLLCGTNRGLFVYDTGARAWRSVNELADKTIYAISEDGRGRLYIGTASGLYLSDEQQGASVKDLRFKRADDGGTSVSASESVRAVVQFQGHTYTATFGRGVERLDDTRRTLIWPQDPADARGREVVSLYADAGGKMWIGTATSGVYVYDGRQATSEQALKELADSAVWSVDGTPDGWVWLATARGLYGYWKGNLKRLLPDVDARRVLAIGAGPAREAWCATAGNGLVKVALSERFGQMTARLDAEQGLPSQSAFALLPLQDKGEVDTLLIGTSRGLARYDPGRVTPILNITRIIGQRIHTVDELRTGLNLEYPQNSLVVDVSATSSRTFPEQFQYAFLLFDSKGALVKQKLARDSQFSMEGLRPGAYRVEVRAYTADLLASSPLTFDFNVAKAPFPWTTAALSALLLLALVALIWAIVEHRRIAHASAALALANHDLADARLRLATEAETERSRIARDLHDQTLADLRRLWLLTDKAPADEKNEGEKESLDPAVFRTEIESVSNEIRRICEDLSPSVLDNVGLTAALEWALSDAVAHLPGASRFEYEFAGDEDLEDRIELAPGVKMQIYRITQEAISNISRHAGARRVRLEVRLTDEGDFLLWLEDDGGGFDLQRDKREGLGRGLANIRARAGLIAAEAGWSNNPAGGTIFTLRKANVARRLDRHA